ncbi:gamma-glutamylcyclotransferase family protein [Thalassotalea fusca]
MYYFAYGSNMSLARIQARIEAVPVKGFFQLPGHSLIFNKVGKDGSAKANIMPHSTHNVFGRLYQLSDEDKSTLDAIEGSGYTCQRVSVKNNSGELIQAYCYIAININRAMRPFDWYLTHILQGAIEADLPSDYVSYLSLINTVEDPNMQRKSSELAIYS